MGKGHEWIVTKNDYINEPYIYKKMSKLIHN